jgi:hypothetical protein
MMTISPPAPAETAPLTIAALMADLAEVPARRATFVEIKTLHALAAPIETHGTLAWQRPDHLEKITEPPHSERLVLDGQRLSLTLGDQPAREIDLASAPPIAGLVEAIRATLAGDLATLQRHYNVGLDGDRAHWRLTLVPRDPAVARFLRVARIEGSGPTPRLVAFEQSNGDNSVMRITPIP